jgi:MoaA/NifB/PqqE/SkfB family radical SAM enzyme
MQTTDASGRSVDGYRAPLFIAWQLTNRCEARCIACCEESGPDAQWRDELTRDEALALAHDIVRAGTPYVAFGGGEPLGTPFFWEILDILDSGGVALKIETNGSRIQEDEADRLAALAVQCIQISVDGPSAEIHGMARPGSSFFKAISAIRLLVQRGLRPQLVFAPNRHNIHTILETFDLAEQLGCSVFVTGPLMRLGRAAHAWNEIACSTRQWQEAVEQLHQRASSSQSDMTLSIYPHDILTEMEMRLDRPQAILLVVPNGKVKLLNALPFAAADLRRSSISEAWDAYRQAWRAPEVRKFVLACRGNPRLLQHANETWPMVESGASERVSVRCRDADLA